MTRKRDRHGTETAAVTAIATEVQRKLRIGEVDDPLEREADQVAERVVGMPESGFAGAVSDAGPAVWRRCERCEEERTVMRREGAARADDVWLADAGAAARPTQRDGHPLSRELRAYFEPRFGHDFSRVRVHTDREAARAARAINARAYTYGRHIVFGNGEYAPHTSEGKWLLAHELTHVVQQGACPTSRARAGSPDAAADGNAAARSSPPDGAPVRPPVVQRRAEPAVQRVVRKGCIAPSFVVDAATASVVGGIVETLIEVDYLAKMGGTAFADVFLDNPLGPMSYIAFLAAHHPSLNVPLLAGQISLSGGVLVPDILDTRAGAAGAPEYYEIKPDSADGRPAGRAKLVAIDAFMGFNSLPYVRGTSYAPTPSIPIPVGSAALAAVLPVPALACGVPIVTLEATRAAPGLLLYQICVEADIDCYLKVITLEALLAAIIIAIILTEGAAAPALAPALGAAAVMPSDQGSEEG